MGTNGTAQTKGDLLYVPSGVARLHYFYGQLLTQRDLEAEQRYAVTLRRLMQREAFGTGTVAGLRVEDAAPKVPGNVVDPPGTPASPPGYITDPSKLVSQIATYWGASFDDRDVERLFARLQSVGLSEAVPLGNLVSQLNRLTAPAGFSLSPGQLLWEYLFDALVGTTYLGLRYDERGTEPSPAVLDASGCGDAACHPARIEEGVMIVAQPAPFAATRDPYLDAKISLEKSFLAQENQTAQGLWHDGRAALCDYLTGAFRGLPPADDHRGAALPPVVSIACVYWSRFSREAPDASRILSIDNRAFRPLAPGVPPIRALSEVLTQGMTPQATRPRFEMIKPANHGKLDSADGKTATVTAQATSRLDAPQDSTWEIDFYPASPAPVIHWSKANPPDPALIQIQLTTTQGPVTTISLQLDAPSGLPRGAYRWRLNLKGSLLQAPNTHAVLDGDPRPPDAVPSGDDMPTSDDEAFEAVFYVP
jgi:hypothetical protein